MTKAELLQAEPIVEALMAPRLEQPAEGLAFFAFFLKEKPTELEPSEVLERLRKGRGVYASELVWDARLELQQRGEGRVVRTLKDLQRLRERTQALEDGMESVKRSASAAALPHTVVRTGDLSWSAGGED